MRPLQPTLLSDAHEQATLFYHLSYALVDEHECVAFLCGRFFRLNDNRLMDEYECAVLLYCHVRVPDGIDALLLEQIRRSDKYLYASSATAASSILPSARNASIR